MTVKTILTEPNKLLRQISKPVKKVGEEERKLVSSIFEDNGGVLFAHGFDGLRTRYLVKEFENNLSNWFPICLLEGIKLFSQELFESSRDEI